MKKKSIKQKVLMSILLCIITFAIFFIIASFSKVTAMSHYYKLDFETGLVTATTLNVRQGPGTNFKIVGTVNKNSYVRVFAGIGDWYVIQTDNDLIGAVSKSYIKAVKFDGTNSNQIPTATRDTKTNSGQLLLLRLQVIIQEEQNLQKMKKKC